jgi:hypothetical protein
MISNRLVREAVHFFRAAALKQVAKNKMEL